LDAGFVRKFLSIFAGAILHRVRSLWTSPHFAARLLTISTTILLGCLVTEMSRSYPNTIHAEDVCHLKKESAKQTTLGLFLSHNWFNPEFPGAFLLAGSGVSKYSVYPFDCRSDVDQGHSESPFRFIQLIAGDFRGRLRAWAVMRRIWLPLLIEWGLSRTETGFSWNGKWTAAPTGKARRATSAAYRHMSILFAGSAADNLQCLARGTFSIRPEEKWNSFENYFPRKLLWRIVFALSAYGHYSNDPHGDRIFRVLKCRMLIPAYENCGPGNQSSSPSWLRSCTTSF